MASLPLEKDFDLKAICNALGGIKTKWFEIGIQLGIPRSKLLEFEEARDPLSAVVDYWLRGNVTESVVPISWTTIVAALKSKYVGEPGLAEEIGKKYCQLQQDTKAEKANDTTSQQSSTKDKQEMDPKVKMDLEFILEGHIEEIIEKYACYVNCILTIIKEKGVSPEDLRSFLLTLSASSKSYKGQKLALLSDKKSELKEKDTINEIFDLLSTECASFMNYNIFQAIIKKYNITEDREELKYHDHLKDYCQKHTITEFVKVNPLLKEKEGSKQLVLKYDIEMTCRLAKVDELQKFIAKILNLHPSTLHIVDIEEGCVVVTFLIPASVADALFTPDTVFTPQQEDKFKAASVQWMKCNGYTFNFGEEAHTKDPAAALRRLKEQLTCSICLATYTNPKLLHCHHSYCQKCLQRLVQQGQQGRLNLTCPTCRHVTPVPASGVADLPADFRTNQFLEIAGEDRKKGETFVPEKVAMASPEKVEDVSVPTLTPHECSITVCCPEHSGKQVELYCDTCMEFICLKCAMIGGKHRKHDCEELDVAFEKCKAEIPSSLANVEKALAQLDAHSDKISNQQAAMEADIHSTIMPDSRKTELISQLHQATLKSLAATQRDQIETIQVQLLQSMRETINSSEGEMLQMRSATVRQVKKLTTSLKQMLNPMKEADLMHSDLVDIITEWKRGMVSAGPPDPSKSYIIGKGELKANVNEKITHFLQIVDIFNKPCCVSVNSITCELVYKNVVLHGRVERRGESWYEISFQPTVVGMQQLHVKVKGQHIRGSPFSVHVQENVIDPIMTIGGVKRPMEVAVNQRGEVVVAERSGHCVTVFSHSGKRLHSIGSFNHSQRGVTLDSDGNIFVVGHKIQKFTAQGQLLATNGTSYYSRGAAFNARNGKVYVPGAICMAILNSDLSFYGGFREEGSGQGQTQGIACDSTGNVYVADKGNNRIHVFTAEGEFLRVITAGVRHGVDRDEKWCPYSVAVDSSGRVYVSTWDHYIDVFTAEGQLLKSFGSYGSRPGQFNYPCGLAVDSSGVCYVCDFGNNRIQLFKISF